MKKVKDKVESMNVLQKQQLAENLLLAYECYKKAKLKEFAIEVQGICARIEKACDKFHPKTVKKALKCGMKIRIIGLDQSVIIEPLKNDRYKVYVAVLMEWRDVAYIDLYSAVCSFKPFSGNTLKLYNFKLDEYSVIYIK